ncbi:hypothetical protein CTAYLR_004533 [Chrysophaeum taylorii]|uniref:Phospholipid/glycerol acyltransferase domain-containing protein n=1 Tax=Chrysophaeum taylorii TaxID=2483200 RepID=A0AAD7UPC5_9STRA|nr:hypothetical protein CTAYLR_004533 [Chrysophaeum taylorii]
MTLLFFWWLVAFKSGAALVVPSGTVRGTVLRTALVEDLTSDAEAVIGRVMDDVRSREAMTEEVAETIDTFLSTYLGVIEDIGRDPESVVDVMREYVDMVEEQLKAPFKFEPLHRAATEPVDYYAMDTSFMEPLIDMEDSVVLGAEFVAEITKQLEKGENVVLLSNHQTEADPSAWSALFDRGDDSWRDESFAKRMIMVAGDRVTTDPVAVPFSKARNLLCIYSKRHIDKPPEMKRAKQLHNTKTMGAMLKLLADGGNMIWVAPSGGRDRPDTAGDFSKPAFFDAKSVEMFRIMANKVGIFKKTHFWPTAMLTYRLFPPPPQVSTGGLGEPRIAMRGSVNACFGPELNFDQEVVVPDDPAAWPEGCADAKDAARALAAAYAYDACKEAYDRLLEAATARGSPYYSAEARKLNAEKVLAEYEKAPANNNPAAPKK